MFQKLSYSEVQEFFIENYVRDLGEKKFLKVADKVMNSNKISGLIGRSRYNVKAITSRDILYTLNSIPFFMVSSNRTQALAGLLTLQRWHNEVNSALGFVNHEQLKLIAIDIIRELKAGNVEIGTSTAVFATRQSDSSPAFRIGDHLFFLPTRLTYEEFLTRLADKRLREQEIPSSKLIRFYYSFNWNELTNSNTANWNLENSAELISYFDKTTSLLTKQNLKFDSFPTAKFLFELMLNQKGWQIESASAKKHNAIASSRDGKYSLELEKGKGFEDDESSWLMLSYLG